MFFAEELFKKTESIIIRLLFSSENGIKILPELIITSSSTFCDFKLIGINNRNKIFRYCLIFLCNSNL